MIKFLIVGLVTFVLTHTASAQKIALSELPSGVREGFNGKYKTARNVAWSKEDKATYEAYFQMDSIAYTAAFSEDGKWLETEQSIEIEDLPSNIKNAISKEYDGYMITESELIDSNDRGRLYEVEVERGEDSISLLINEDGKILEREKDSDEG